MKGDTRLRILATWAALAGVPRTAEWLSSQSVVHIAPRSNTCPPGWVGVVVIERAVLATAPSEREAAAFRPALASWIGGGDLDPGKLAGLLGAVETLGPISLSYLDTEPDDVTAGHVVESAPRDGAQLRGLLQVCDADEVEESGLQRITSPAFVVRDGAEVLAAAGYQVWQRDIAHLGVLTAKVARRRGLGTAVAGAATRHALEAGLVAQWRTRTAPSHKVAEHLGFEDAGWQQAFRLDHTQP